MNPNLHYRRSDDVIDDVRKIILNSNVLVHFHDLLFTLGQEKKGNTFVSSTSASEKGIHNLNEVIPSC